MTQLKGGNVVAIRTKDGQVLENEDGSPLTIIIEDSKGEKHELYLSVGRMGTFLQATLPPFRVGLEGDYGEGTVPAAPEKREISLSGNEDAGDMHQGIPVAVAPKRGRARDPQPRTQVP